MRLLPTFCASRVERSREDTVSATIFKVQRAQARRSEGAAIRLPFFVARSSVLELGAAPWLTALMRGVILIQPARCKPFGPVLSGEVVVTPYGAPRVLSGLGRGRLSSRPFFASCDHRQSARVPPP
jgi:hypothetical protein